VKKSVAGWPALMPRAAVVSSSAYSRVSNGSPATSAMPHFRQRPPSLAVTSGCIGQNHAVVSAGGAALLRRAERQRQRRRGAARAYFAA
jgi:hypothetical protein